MCVEGLEYSLAPSKVLWVWLDFDYFIIGLVYFVDRLPSLTEPKRYIDFEGLEI